MLIKKPSAVLSKLEWAPEYILPSLSFSVVLSETIFIPVVPDPTPRLDIEPPEIIQPPIYPLPEFIAPLILALVAVKFPFLSTLNLPFPYRIYGLVKLINKPLPTLSVSLYSLLEFSLLLFCG